MTACLRTVFMGTPDFAVPTLEMLAANTRLQLVITQPDRRQGRGKKLQFSPVKEKALALGVDVIGPPVVKGKRFAQKIAELRPDVILTAAFGRILGPALLAVPRYGCLNVHASILPLYRGAAPVNWAIINGDKETGVSIMKTVPRLDAGDVFRVHRLPVDKQTAGELTAQLAAAGAAALLETLREIADIEPVPQNDAEATFAPMLRKQDGQLDWSRGAVALERQIRGMHPWPGTFFVWNESVVKVHSGVIVSDEDVSEPPGTVLAHSAHGVDVSCGRGVLRMTSLQMPGKKRLTAQQFYAGVKIPAGTQLLHCAGDQPEGKCHQHQPCIDPRQ